jgi:hypothetical protein
MLQPSWQAEFGLPAGCSGRIDSAASQEWTMESNGTAGINGQCLDITRAGTANGTLIEEWTCTGGANQQWRVP